MSKVPYSLYVLIHIEIISASDPKLITIAVSTKACGSGSTELEIKLAIAEHNQKQIDGIFHNQNADYNLDHILFDDRAIQTNHKQQKAQCVRHLFYSFSPAIGSLHLKSLQKTESAKMTKNNDAPTFRPIAIFDSGIVPALTRGRGSPGRYF